MSSPIDRTTFDGLVVAHLLAAQRFAVRLSGDPEVAEEMVQEALLRASRGWQTFRGESRFTTWLFQIVVNVFRDRVSARPPPTELPDALADRRSVDPHDAASAQEQGERIARMVSGLPPRQREVLVLHAYERLPIAELAAVLEITEQNARTHLALARKKLREQLSELLIEKKP